METGLMYTTVWIVHILVVQSQKEFVDYSQI